MFPCEPKGADPQFNIGFPGRPSPTLSCGINSKSMTVTPRNDHRAHDKFNHARPEYTGKFLRQRNWCRVDNAAYPAVVWNSGQTGLRMREGRRGDRDHAALGWISPVNNMQRDKRTTAAITNTRRMSVNRFAGPCRTLGTADEEWAQGSIPTRQTWRHDAASCRTR